MPIHQRHINTCFPMAQIRLGAWTRLGGQKIVHNSTLDGQKIMHNSTRVRATYATRLCHLVPGGAPLVKRLQNCKNDIGTSCAETNLLEALVTQGAASLQNLCKFTQNASMSNVLQGGGASGWATNYDRKPKSSAPTELLENPTSKVQQHIRICLIASDTQDFARTASSITIAGGDIPIAGSVRADPPETHKHICFPLAQIRLGAWTTLDGQKIMHNSTNYTIAISSYRQPIIHESWTWNKMYAARSKCFADILCKKHNFNKMT